MIKAIFPKQKGFTLIEILVVIGIIAVLATIVLIAINPARQFAQARDSQRTSNVNAILNAIGQYIADNKGTVPSEITSTDQDISKLEADLCSTIVSKYMSALPVDPGVDPDGVGALGKGESITDCTISYDTGYDVVQDSGSGRITVSAPTTEPAIPRITPIEVTR